ncbi:TnsA endonuclease N-terminal domain-containing protein [Dyella tabacisoli]|uniref:TnsA endonuclease N-terminal domain-containing protein n=1 Tax=Dyella tabacisoli TaxID=2282381 RepID=UPI0013B38976|nr:TnsA endonuclease N-terminal domain-containing protein [Dyella tabacisoli]
MKGIVVDRTHHLLSELEATYFYLIERRAQTVDILEQWPILDIDGTMQLSRQWGVRHPFKGPYPEPFTVDLLIAEQTTAGPRFRAASIKTPDDANNPAIRQRLAIEHAWCKARGIPWTLVDTRQFNRVLLANLRFLRGWYRHRFTPSAGRATQFAHAFSKGYETNVPLVDLISRTAVRLRMNVGSAQDLFRYCGWTERVAVSLTDQITLDRPLVLRRKVPHADL